MSDQQEKQVVIAAVTAAAQLCQEVRRIQQTKTLLKLDSSPVTVADFGAQAIICQTLAASFPDEPIIAEEDATILTKPESRPCLLQIIEQVSRIIPNTTENKILNWLNLGNGQIAPRYWTLDPIDGTKGFLRGDQYAIALALIEEGEVKLGVMACPALPFDYGKTTKERGVIFLGSKDQGTVMMSGDGKKVQRLSLDQSQDHKQLRLVESVESSHSDRRRQQSLATRLGIVSPPLRMDSQAKYGVVARGEADVYVRIPLPQFAARKENIWDHAAGMIVVTEAGGKVTDLDGQPLDFSLGPKLVNNRGIVVTNGRVHQQVIEALA